MGTQRFVVTIPACWVGLSVYGNMSRVEGRWVDRWGRAVERGRAADLDDPRPRLSDHRGVVFRMEDGASVGALLVANDNRDPDRVGYRLWTEVAGRWSCAADADHLSETDFVHADDPSCVVRVAIRLRWPTPAARDVAIDTAKRLWGLTRTAAARVVDEPGSPLLHRPGDSHPSANRLLVLAGMSVGRLPAAAVVPFALDGLAGRWEGARAGGSHGTVFFHGDDAGGECAAMVQESDWSRVFIAGDWHPTGCPPGGGPEPRRTGRRIARLIADHPGRHDPPLGGLGPAELGEKLSTGLYS